MSSLCRHAMRGQSYVALVRSGVSRTRCGLKTCPSLQKLALAPTATAAVPRRGLHISSPLQQAATPGQAGSVEASSAGGNSGWTGGDGRDGHAGARTLGIAVFSTLVGATACLGTWQVMRYSWKLDMIEDRKEKMAFEPVQLPEGLEGEALAKMMDILDKEADGKGAKGPDGETLGGSEEGKGLLESLAGRRVRVTGVFDHTKEVLVGPRGAPPGMNASTGPASMAVSPQGDFVHTPLRRKDGSVVLVNRGWSPRSKGRNWSRPEGEVSLVGVLKEAEKRRTFSPVNRPETGQLLWAEKEALLQAAGCLAPGDGVSSPPILMEAVGEEGDDRKVTPRAKQRHHFGEFYVTPQTHAMYAATWYSLAAAGALLTWTRFRRRGPAAFPKIKAPGAAGGK
eukprot:jgi/Undpi1/6803/HiC_scaffold_21.g09279.m1